MTPKLTPAIAKAADKAHALDSTTQDLLKKQQTKDTRFRTWCYISLTLVIALGVVGIFKQNEIATQNKNHIDCIVKLFTSPNRASKVITNPATSCDIVEAK